MSKKIGIIGSGPVAQALAKGFKKHGYNPLISSRDPHKTEAFAKQEGFQFGSFAEAAAFGDLLVLAVNGSAAEAVIKSIGAKVLSGKTIIDTTNPIAEGPPVDGVLQFFTGPNESLMERLQKKAPDARFVKCFNSVGNPKMVNPHYAEGKPTMFIAGNSPEAKAEVSAILDAFGWETADMGPAVAARAIEPLAILWCINGFAHNEWTHAFKVLHEGK